MTTIPYSSAFSFFVYIFLCYILINAQDIAKLPYCNEEIKRTELIFVSTLDGLLTALNPSGAILWQVETGPGPLLTSNIHKLELTNNGQWLRIIPSLAGSLYKFDGITIDPIPISADTLLTSSFRYSDDLVIAGGREVRTYGVLLNSGTRLYECSLGGCKNTTDYSDDLDDIIIIERTTHTVRAVEPRTGAERWNFSVGQHNIKIPYVDCIDANMKNVNFNISAVLPEGLLIATKLGKFSEILWQYKFETPIVAVWKWNGRELVPTNLFNTAIKNGKSGSTSMPSIYVGMHNKQLYVHESRTMQNILHLQHHTNDKHSVVESRSLTQIPWKPIPATGMNTLHEETDDSTALSVLYASEYVNGNGYYLYTEEKTTCENNITTTIATQQNNAVIWYWWKEICVVALSTVIIWNVVYNYRLVGFGTGRISKQDGSPSSFQHVVYDRNDSNSESSDILFASRYAAEFEPISCLGKGGFGVVFQAKKKFDECDYAVKRITLPNRPTARDRMMREVKALAKLDHGNIVRYYNAWLECPPYGWQQEHDKQWLSDISTSYFDKSVSTRGSFNNRNSSLAINMESSNLTISSDTDTVLKKNSTEIQGSSIIFANDTKTATKSQLSSTCNHIDKDQNHLSHNYSHSLNLFDTRPAPVYLYIQMQLCCKESLKDWLCNNPDRDRSYALSLYEQIVDAVEYVHFRGLIHRDLKPSNIFFSLEGQIKVGDFGLVTSIKEYDGGDSNQDNSSTTTLLQKSYTNAVGTHLYMSPEQLTGQQYDHKVDIYSLGIIFFELLVPFRTEMERMKVLTDLKNNLYPENFPSTFCKEHEVLDLMLAENPVIRPQASEIRTRLLAEEIYQIESNV